jgi:hypothetical protein
MALAHSAADRCSDALTAKAGTKQRTWSLSGAKQKSRAHAPNDVNDPSRYFVAVN